MTKGGSPLPTATSYDPKLLGAIRLGNVLDFSSLARPQIRCSDVSKDNKVLKKIHLSPVRNGKLLILNGTLQEADAGTDASSGERQNDLTQRRLDSRALDGTRPMA